MIPHDTTPSDRLRVQPFADPIGGAPYRKVSLYRCGHEWAVYSVSGIRLAGPGTYSAMVSWIESGRMIRL